MSTNYLYRTLTVEDILPLTELYLAAFSQTVKDGFFKWKYFENPFGDTLLMGAFFGGELIGAGAMIHEVVNNGDRLENIFKFTDIMTHPDHQQKGISRAITLKLEEEIGNRKNVITYTIGSKISNKNLIRNNWVFIGRILYFFQPRIILKVKYFFKRATIENCVLSHDLAQLPVDYAFSNKHSAIVLNKTVPYLKWRISNPNFIYKCLMHYDSENQLDGYMIFSITPNNLINIIDFDHSKTSIFNEMLFFLEKYTLKNKCRGIVMMTLEETRLYKFMKERTRYWCNKQNFGPLHSILNFFIKTEGPRDKYSDNALYWDFTPLNYDDI